jgi:5-formyltetrahydrofolate cyclo-ligase
MVKTTDVEPDTVSLASSPCMLHELDPEGRPRVDPEQALDVARWRKVERKRLIAERCALSQDFRTKQTLAITHAIDQILAATSLLSVSVYWPIRGEFDLRPWIRALWQRGVRIALPVAVALDQPLVFREWCPHTRLAHGLWNIPYPAEGAVVVPNAVIAPLVGFDAACYRLGYGGGFFDRTLATLSPKPVAIGIGYPGAEVSTIFPQPHDVPMDWIVTGSSVPIRCMERPAR